MTDNNTNQIKQTDNGKIEQKLWLREKEIIKMLSVSRFTLWNWVKKKTFPQPFKIGCCTFWKVKEVMEFVEQNQN